MYSFFSRHEVDKQGKDWDNAENPSNGKIMWLAWGGDAGFSWSRKIVNREKTMKKNLELNEIVEEIKDMFDDVVNPITKTVTIEVEIDDEEDGYEDCGCETCKTMDIPCEECPICSEMDKADMTDTAGCTCEGCMECKANGGCDMKKCQGHNGMKKAEELSDEEISKNYVSDNEEEDNWDNMEKACWSGYKQEGMKDKNGRMVPNCVPVQKSIFSNLDPYEMTKRKFSAQQRKTMAENGEAMPDGSYPIANKTDLMNAIRSWGRGGSDPKVKSHIKSRAKALDALDMIPDNWK
jgi:hypothetical protein